MASHSGDGDKPTVNNASRYGDAGPTKLDKVEEILPEQVPGLVADLRRVFDAEKSRPIAWRMQQLRAFRRMVTEGEAELCAAMKADLHKSEFEGFATEVGLLVAEVDTALANLHEWVKPVKTRNSGLNIPCWSSTQRDPLGVCLIMGAWNYPVQLQLAPVVGCIAGGNCAVLKPGSYAKESSNAIARLVRRYMDPECFRVIEGNREITSTLLAQRFDLIFFTGSAYVGKIVARAAAEHLTPCVLELGGKSPCIVDRTADLRHAAKRIVWGKFMNAGQTCIANDFMCVHEAVADELLEEIKRTVRELYGKDPRKTEFYGRLINDAAFKRLTKLVEADRERIVIGGESVADERYLAPTVLDFGTDMEAFKASEVMADEIFGPILPVYRYSDLEEVVQFVRNLHTGKPLALYAYGNDSTFTNTIKTRTTSGGLCINDSVMHIANHELPFGGVGNSGMGGGYHGHHSFERFTHLKAVLEKSPAIDQLPVLSTLLEARFPPYTPFKKTVVRVFGMDLSERLVNLPVPALRLLLKAALVYFILSKLGLRITMR